MTAPGVEATASAVLDAALGWEPDARVLGNVRAREVAALARHVLGVHPSHLTTIVDLLETERADLRAEVERLRKVAEAARMFFSQPYDNGQHETALRDAVADLLSLPAGEDGRDG